MNDPSIYCDQGIDPEAAFVIDDFAAWMDGGSVTMFCSNEADQHFNIHFQHWATGYHGDDTLPGRLYFCGKLVEERSELEETLLAQFEQVEPPIFHNRKDIQKIDRQILDNIIDYIRSDDYIELIRKVEELIKKKKDSTH